jgi:hypothetical protein
VFAGYHVLHQHRNEDQLSFGVFIDHLNGTPIIFEYPRIELMTDIAGEQADDLEPFISRLTKTEGHFLIFLTDLNDISLVAAKVPAIGCIATKFNI